MKIVHVASELFPYVKTGGLADAVGALARTLAASGHEVTVFIPAYRAVLEHPDVINSARRVHQLRIEMGDTFMSGDVRVFQPAPNLRVFLIGREEFFDRRQLYGTDERDYEDNHHRYIFFCKGVVETLRFAHLEADIVHGHDWQAGLLPLLIRHAERRSGATLALRTIHAIHNIAFQGLFPLRSFYRTNLPEELAGMDGVEFYGQASMMKAGLLFADRLTTVSPRYAQEIQTQEFGCGLDGVVQTRVDDLTGLLNGIDTDVWNPATDPLLPGHYTAEDLGGKKLCRAELLKKSGFDPRFSGPIFGMVTRLTQQKGVDFVTANRAFFERENVRLIVVGRGDASLEASLRELAGALPGKVALAAMLDERMSHLVEAGSDFFLMPSRFEPCGLNQMYSQAYGTIPIVTRVGGLVDTVVDLDESPRDGTGLTVRSSPEGVYLGLKRALQLYADKPRLLEVRRRAMRRDFSWKKAARAYEQLYEGSL
jgi:starch synthase